MCSRGSFRSTPPIAAAKKAVEEQGTGTTGSRMANGTFTEHVKLEQELAQMAAEEAAEFLNEFNIPASAMDRVIQESYQVLNLISFFTIISNEVRAWTVKKGTRALAAAGHIHSDMQKGFIRAEVISFQNLMAAGSYSDAKKQGTVRLEGKAYEVQDGDVVQFRFNV